MAGWLAGRFARLPWARVIRGLVSTLFRAALGAVYEEAFWASRRGFTNDDWSMSLSELPHCPLGSGNRGERESIIPCLEQMAVSSYEYTRLPRSPLILGSPSCSCEKLGHIAFRNHVQEGCHTGSGMYQDVETGRVSTSACQHIPMILQSSSFVRLKRSRRAVTRRVCDRPLGSSVGSSNAVHAFSLRKRWR